MVTVSVSASDQPVSTTFFFATCRAGGVCGGGRGDVFEHPQARARASSPGEPRSRANLRELEGIFMSSPGPKRLALRDRFRYGPHLTLCERASLPRLG